MGMFEYVMVVNLLQAPTVSKPLPTKLGDFEEYNKRVVITPEMMENFGIPADSYQPGTLERIPNVADDDWARVFEFQTFLQKNGATSWQNKLDWPSLPEWKVRILRFYYYCLDTKY